MKLSNKFNSTIFKLLYFLVLGIFNFFLISRFCIIIQNPTLGHIVEASLIMVPSILLYLTAHFFAFSYSKFKYLKEL